MNQIKITYRKLEELKPYENNPRINEGSVDAVANSIDNFGFKVPMIIDKNDVIISGHTRRLAALKLGLTEVPTVLADDLTDEEIKALRIADNKVGENSEWDFSKLKKELDGITDIDMTDFNINFDEVNSFILRNTTDDKEEIKTAKKSTHKTENDIEKESEEAKKLYKLGDIYNLGNHYLMCGDATNKDHIEKLIKDKDVKLLLTDPPYGINVVKPSKKVESDTKLGFKGKISPGDITESRVYKNVEGDNSTDVFKKTWNIIKDKKFNMIIWGGNYFLNFLPFSSNFIIWKKKDDNVLQNTFSDGEIAWCNFKTQTNIFSYNPIQVIDLKWNGINKYKGNSEGEDKMERFHPTQKPVKLSTDVLLKFSNENDYILDLFGGSGSSLIAAEKNNRKMLMMEYDPYYIKNIIERWEEFTGKKAVKIEDKETE